MLSKKYEIGQEIKFRHPNRDAILTGIVHSISPAKNSIEKIEYMTVYPNNQGWFGSMTFSDKPSLYSHVFPASLIITQ